ncbi:MAG: UbiA family prenyltransferase [Oscillospiraceae bacterium]|nr:UbiA family prenyltransferase [Oscillospiraceae bacterium]MDD4413587.1 UbiA family prenyltransferase [Oscillospiraceae bacterium]
MVKRFLKYVEITTKITSVFAFLLSIAFLFASGQKINLTKTLIFFAAMFLFDLTTTAINNYVDTKTNEQVLQFKRKVALLIILVLFITSATLGIYLAYITDIVVLLLGGLCFLVGVFYSYGPIPISRLPLGEIFSGLFYGLFIPFIMLYINMPENTYLTLELSLKTIHLSLEVMPLITMLLLSVTPFCTTANIMLANNICDLKNDIAVKRYTLPYYLGRNALYLFAGLYYLAYASIILMVIWGILSPVCLLVLLTVIPVQKNINIFYKNQDKSTTFITSVKNYVIIMSAECLLVFISGFA